jgi:uncharacterized LabA/DUF88 family protein
MSKKTADCCEVCGRKNGQATETAVLIDGENFKGKISTIFAEKGKSKPIWHQYDFMGLIASALDGKAFGRVVFYFARIREHERTKSKSMKLIEEQRLYISHLRRQGIEVTLGGNVRGNLQKVFDREGNEKEEVVFKEKGVDVKIGVDMVAMSCDRTAKEIILGSSDSDLIPAVRETIKRNLPCTYLSFESNLNLGLANTTRRVITISDEEVISFGKAKELGK